MTSPKTETLYFAASILGTANLKMLEIPQNLRLLGKTSLYENCSVDLFFL